MDYLRPVVQHTDEISLISPLSRLPFKWSASLGLFSTGPQIKKLPDSHVAIVQEMGQQSIKMPLDNLI